MDANDKETPLAVIENSAHEDIRISLSRFKGCNYLDIRVFANYTGKFVPTKKGITLKADLLPKLLAALAQVN